MLIAAALLILVLLAVYALALWQVWRAPFRGLGVLVAGFAFHNFLIMVLLRLGTPAVVVRVVQAWKEGILALLFAFVLVALWRAWRQGQSLRVHPIDLAFGVFALLAVLYTLAPHGLLHGEANLQQRLLGLRVVLLLPLLYLYGRVFQPRSHADLRWVAWAIAASAAVVGLFGLIELWLVPTTVWLDWGVNQLSSWLGFVYNGPRGLPANFFQTTGEGLLLRRMVSTYVSPLGIAYAGLLVVPVVVALILDVRSRWQRWLVWACALLTLASILFSLTRLALLMTVAELLFLAVLTRVRWVLYAAPVAAVLSAFMVLEFVNVGPLLDRTLQPVANRPSHMRIASTGDPSLNEHAGLLGYDLQYVLQHPLGTGIGSSVHRFGTSQGTAESAILDMFGDMGILGGLLYLFLYASAFFVGVFAFFRVRRVPLLGMLPLVCAVGAPALGPITLTSDLWGDLSTTYLFWWAAGASLSLYLGRRFSEPIPDTAPASAPDKPRGRTRS